MVGLEGESPAAEAFRTLRTNLQFAGGDRTVRTLVVTGVGADEGKTTVAANLAATLAAGGTRTLAVGADLRRPALHRLFGVDGSRGLTQVLSGRLSLDEAVVHVEPPGLDVLPAGPIPPNPAELLGSHRMAALMQTMAERWEMVVIDTPPAVGLADASVVAVRADGTLLVVSVGLTSREEAQLARRQLEQVGARILGVVLNGVSPHGGYYRYYRYYAADGLRRGA